MLEIKDLTIKINKIKIIDSINFSAKPGDITTIIGPNGSGKSTLIKSLSGDLPYNGQILLNNHELKNIPLSKLAFQRSVLEQKSFLAFPFSVLEVMQIGIQKTIKENSDELISDILRLFNLEGLRNKNFFELSGGQQQRVQIARTLAQVYHSNDNYSKWLFLDEPISSLDIKYQLEVMNIIKKFSLSGGGVLMIMHDLNMSSIFSDYILLMRDGMKLGFGNPKDILNDNNLSKAYDCNIKVRKDTSDTFNFVLPDMIKL
tara:strand:+ start:441 stop:1217 length:777 start_codon:yes stop_codon:yes gene_type:complete